jgi:hypothetical protein
MKEKPLAQVRQQRLTAGRLMNLERSEAVAKRFFEKDQEKREVRSFYNQVIAEFNNKCELMEKVKA